MKKNKSKKNPKDGFMCEADGLCERQFGTLEGMKQHMRKAHPPEPYVPPPPPKKMTTAAPNQLDEDHHLIGGKRVDVGDVVYIKRKCVVVSRTETEGSEDLDVVLKVTKRWWSNNE